MSVIQIAYWDPTVPKLELHQQWIRLILNNRKTSKDSEALHLFESLATLLDESSRLRYGFILTVVKANQVPYICSESFPLLIADARYSSIDEMRELMAKYKEISEAAEIE